MVWLTLGQAVPAQCLAGEVPEGHGAIAGPGQQEGGVRRQCAHSERTAARVLEHRGDLTCPRAPHDHRAVRGAAEQVAAARAEAAAVNPVPVTRQRGAGELREVRGVINTEGLIPGGGGQQGWREGAAAHLVRVLLQGDGQWHHLVGTEARRCRGSASLTRWRKMLKYPSVTGNEETSGGVMSPGQTAARPDGHTLS